MRIKRQVLCIDIESTCWREGDQIPFGYESEIIEIGVQCVDIKTKSLIGNSVSLLIKPDRSEISEFCTELTTITPEMVNAAPRFKDVFSKFVKEYDTHNSVFASWGQYDKNMIKKQCERYRISYPFGSSHLNVKDLFAATYGYTGQLAEMGKELDLEIAFVGTEHRGHDDARMVAQILIRLLK